MMRNYFIIVFDEVIDIYIHAYINKNFAVNSSISHNMQMRKKQLLE